MSELGIDNDRKCPALDFIVSKAGTGRIETSVTRSESQGNNRSLIPLTNLKNSEYVLYLNIYVYVYVFIASEYIILNQSLSSENIVLWLNFNMSFKSKNVMKCAHCAHICAHNICM